MYYFSLKINSLIIILLNVKIHFFILTGLATLPSDQVLIVLSLGDTKLKFSLSAVFFLTKFDCFQFLQFKITLEMKFLFVFECHHACCEEHDVNKDI